MPDTPPGKVRRFMREPRPRRTAPLFRPSRAPKPPESALAAIEMIASDPPSW